MADDNDKDSADDESENTLNASHEAIVNMIFMKHCFFINYLKTANKNATEHQTEADNLHSLNQWTVTGERNC